MDHDVKAFRTAAERENGSRTGLQRRYSPALRAQAVRCWQVRQRAGEALREVAVALGVAPWSLHRWTRTRPTSARLHPVQVVPLDRPTAGATLVVVLSAEQTRVEGLDVETAARLLALLRWHGRRVAVYAYGRPADMRKGFDGLSALVTQALARDPLSGEVFLFVSRDRVRTKVLHWD